MQKHTSKRVGSEASHLLRHTNRPIVKSVAGSDLSQRPQRRAGKVSKRK
jgi:hypothetical protein